MRDDTLTLKLKIARRELLDKMNNIINKIDEEITKSKVISKMDDVILLLDNKINKK
jgi:hypothetical protein